MKVVAMTGLSYPTVRTAIDLFDAGSWNTIRPALRGRARGDGRVLSQVQEDTLQLAVRPFGIPGSSAQKILNTF